MAQFSCPPPALTLWEAHTDQQQLPPGELLPDVQLCHTPRRQALLYTPILQMRKQKIFKIWPPQRVVWGRSLDRGHLSPLLLPASADRSCLCLESGRGLSADKPPPGSPRLLHLPTSWRLSHTPAAPPSFPELLPAHRHASPCPGAGEWPGAPSLPALQHTSGHQDVRGGCHHRPSEASEEGMPAPESRAPPPHVEALLLPCWEGVEMGSLATLCSGPGCEGRGGPRCLFQSCEMAGPTPSCPLFQGAFTHCCATR